MWEYEKNRKHTTPSQELLREAHPRQERDGEAHLTGYHPHEQEGKRRPREFGRLENSFGDIAVGTNRNKEVMVVVSRRRTEEGPAVSEDEKVLNGNRAVSMGGVRGAFQVNSHDEEKSAVAYRRSARKNAGNMVGQIREMMTEREQETIWKQAPFFNRQPEQEEMKLLREEELELRHRSEPEDRERLREVERRSQQLRRRIEEKEGQERRLRFILEKAREEAEKQGEAPWDSLLRAVVQREQEEQLDEDDEKGTGEEAGETDGKARNTAGEEG